MMSFFASHKGAVVLALLVTFLWSTSWVLIKLGLDELPPLTFAGLRYALGFLCLVPYAMRFRRARPLVPMKFPDWLILIGFGILFYGITQGAQFMALLHLPAAGLSLLLNLSPLLIAALSFVLLGERLEWRHGFGLGLCLVGVVLYFGPERLLEEAGLGIFLGAVCLLANALSTVLGRGIQRSGRYPSGLVTLISMGAGSVALLTVGLVMEPWPGINATQALLIGWLAVVNTALAFLLWNNVLKHLTATEAGVINNAMLPQIAVLSWIFLGEALDLRQILAIVLVMLAVVSLQRLGRR